MERIKAAVKSLQDAVFELETVIYTVKKNQTQTHDRVQELKTVIKNTYDRLDRVLGQIKKGEE